MSIGWQIAIGISLIAGGSAGYEYRSAIGHYGVAAFEFFVIVAGIWMVASGIDKLVQS